ncbi:unnamed protein product, partial [Adineta ricciae]
PFAAAAVAGGAISPRAPDIASILSRSNDAEGLLV